MHELPGLWVRVDRIEYRRDKGGTEDRPYCFVYHITIHNDSPQVVTLRGRKWIVTAADGSKLVIEGKGVGALAGDSPRLIPGFPFRYTGYHLVGTDSIADGSYVGIMDDGTRVFTRIPSFRMEVPRF